MYDVISQFFYFRFVIVFGVLFFCFIMFFVLQCVEELEVIIMFFEILVDDLLMGFEEGCYDVGMMFWNVGVLVVKS